MQEMNLTQEGYDTFLNAKIKLAQKTGFDCDPSEINPALRPHNKLMVQWMVQGGRRACFAAFGLHKTVTQLEAVRIILTKTGGRGLIICPLGVRQEFARDAVKLLGWNEPPKFIRRIEEADETGIYLTNYETVRDGKLDPRLFAVASLDEASVLRGFGGSKTFREFMRLFTGDAGPLGDRRGTECVPYRFVATATPSPNDYIELLAYADFLGIMDVSQAKTRFFKRDSTQADKLTLHAHKEEEFWLWVASWALFVQRPSDLTGSEADDTGYILPPMEINWHELPSDHSDAGVDRKGQALMFKNAAAGLKESAKEKRDTVDARVAKMLELRALDPDAHRLLWHDTERERAAIKAAIPAAVTVQGKDSDEHKENSIIGFSDGEIHELAGKPCMLGSGCNFQRHCAWEIFLGIGYKFNDFIQAIHRTVRFGQTKAVRIDLIYTEAEREVRRTLEKKWQQHNDQVAIMTAINKRYGLSQAAMAKTLTRKTGVERIEISGRNFRIFQNDNVKETRDMADNSVGLILTSWPFGNQYEYSPNYADFGHTDNPEHFFAQMDYLTPELHRVLQPGRIYAIHVKDRIQPKGLSGFGFQTVYPFHMDAIAHMQKHGFGYMGMKTIVTDVVRENAQTYRLGWTEQCKDGTKMGVGMPEYLLLFRKRNTDESTGYADVPVVKNKPQQIRADGMIQDFNRDNDLPLVPGSGYSRSRWQMDAHGFTRSAGNRLLTPGELEQLDHDVIFKLFKQHSLESVYDFEQHVSFGERLEGVGRMPTSFMLLQPQSWSDEVWTDITRMLTLNGSQWSKGKEMHLCLAEGSLVLTRAGYIPIEDVIAGDEVLTHEGRWKKVLIARKTGENREVVDLHAQGVAGLRLTPDHNVWTRRADGARAVDAAKRTLPQWQEAAQTVGHYVNLKLPPVEPSNLTEPECWLIGRWLADGHIGTRGDYWISVNPDKLADFEARAGIHAGTRNPGTAVQVRLKELSPRIRNVIDRCGKGAAGKRTPSELLSLDINLSKAVLDGYLSGDGHYIKARKRWAASSISRSLLLGIAILVQRVYGTTASLCAGRPAGTTTIEGRTVQTSQEWALSFDADTNGRKKPLILEDGAWKRVRSAEPSGTSDVWCLKVEDDASFTAEGCIVKNCPMQFDLADRVIAQMSNPGEVVYDPFGGLMTVPFRAIKLGRFGMGCELSPTYFADGAAYCRAAELEANVPTLFDTLEAAVQEDVAA